MRRTELASFASVATRCACGASLLLDTACISAALLLAPVAPALRRPDHSSRHRRRMSPSPGAGTSSWRMRRRKTSPGGAPTAERSTTRTKSRSRLWNHRSAFAAHPGPFAAVCSLANCVSRLLDALRRVPGLRHPPLAVPLWLPYWLLQELRIVPPLRAGLRRWRRRLSGRSRSAKPAAASRGPAATLR